MIVQNIQVNYCSLSTYLFIICLPLYLLQYTESFSISCYPHLYPYRDLLIFLPHPIPHFALPIHQTYFTFSSFFSLSLSFFFMPIPPSSSPFNYKSHELNSKYTYLLPKNLPTSTYLLGPIHLIARTPFHPIPSYLILTHTHTYTYIHATERNLT
jgi:hypothetical protein